MCTSTYIGTKNVNLYCKLLQSFLCIWRDFETFTVNCCLQSTYSVILSQRQKHRCRRVWFKQVTYLHKMSQQLKNRTFLVTFVSNIFHLYSNNVVTNVCYNKFADPGFCWHLWLIHFKCSNIFWIILLLLCVRTEHNILLTLRVKWNRRCSIGIQNSLNTQPGSVRIAVWV